MADIAKRADAQGGLRLVESMVQSPPQRCAQNVSTGDALYIVAASGDFSRSPADGPYFGLAADNQTAGLAVSAVRVGYFDGFVLDSLGFGAVVHTSVAAGAVADASGAGTRQIGRVIRARGSADADKILYVGEAV